MPPYGILPAARPDPYAGANTQAFMGILQTLGQYETLRRQRQMSSDILGVLQGGGDPQKTTMENIAGVVQRHQQPTYSPGLQGLLQRIAAPFAAPVETGITDMLLKGTVESAFSEPTLASERLKKYYETGDERFLIGQPTVQIGERLLTPEQRQALAEKGFTEEMGLSTSQINMARQSVKTLVKETPDRFAPGWFDYSRDMLIDMYKRFRVENDYESKSRENRDKLDEIFDNQIETYNKVGHTNVMGTDEFDWDPEDDRVKEIRGEPLEVYKSASDKSAHQSIIKVWDKLPKEMQAEITALHSTGMDWEEIATADDLKPYLEK